MSTLADAVAQLLAVADTLRALDIPDAVIHGLSVDRWSSGTVVGIHINGATAEHVALVDRIADHYDLPPDEGETSNYTRGGSLGLTPVLVFCGRPEPDPS